MAYGLAFGTASIVFRVRISKMQEAMNQFRLVWQSDLSVKAKAKKVNALVWNKGRWSLHLFPLLPTLQQKIDAAQARYLRRILKLPAAYISRISHQEVRRRCGTYRFSTSIFRICKNRLRYSRERSSQSLPKISHQLVKKLE